MLRNKELSGLLLMTIGIPGPALLPAASTELEEVETVSMTIVRPVTVLCENSQRLSHQKDQLSTTKYTEGHKRTNQ